MMRSEVIKMELVILTNNEKVLSEAFKYATVKYRRATAVDIVLEARYLAQKGGKLAADMMKVPTKSFFRSIPMEHTPEGGYISVAGKETDEYTEIIVTDTGSGIDPKDLPHIFERYYRGHNSNKQGSGIGLALSKMIIEKQNGKVSVENRPQGGARFDIKFFK